MTHSAINWRRFGASLGLTAGVFLWAINLQLGEMLPAWQCHAQNSALGFTSIVGAALSLTSGYVSWRTPWPSRAGWFWSRLCTLTSVLFAFALLLHGAAGFMLSGCEK